MTLHTIHLMIACALVIGAFVAFLREWLPPDLVALSTLAILLVSETIGTEDALEIFSNSAPVTIGCMFVLSAALESCVRISKMNPGERIDRPGRLSDQHLRVWRRRLSLR